MKPTLLIMVGLIGTGKSTLAQALSERLGAVVISSDITRKRLAGIPETEHRYEGFNQGLYSPEFTVKTYIEMLFGKRPKEFYGVLKKGGIVIFDASFSEALYRHWAKIEARMVGANFLVVECVLDEKILKERLANRKDTASDGRWDIYQEQKKAFEQVVELLPNEHIVVDTSKPVDENIKQILAKVGEGDE